MSICKTILFENPIELALDDLNGTPLVVFFALGIVNPFGPTLNLVATAGYAAPGGELPIVHIMLNPFSQRVTQIGKMEVGSQWNPLRGIAPLIARDYGGCPTLLLITDQVEEEERLQLATQIFVEFGDRVGGVLQSVKKHVGDPWTRVSEEMGGVEYQVAPRPIEELSEELASIVLGPEHFIPELKALISAWRGSIEETRISDELKFRAMSTERFTTFLSEKILPTVWMPDL